MYRRNHGTSESFRKSDGCAGFLRDRRGGVTVLFAGAAALLLTGIAVTVAIGQTNVVRSRLQDITDAAVLAGAKEPVLANRTARMEAMFASNTAQGGVGTNVTVIQESADDKTTQMGAQTQVNPLPGIAWLTTTVRVYSKAQVSTSGVEVAIVIDNTGSLGQTGMEAARAGARELIQDLLPDSGDTSNVVSLIPFGASVNFGSSHTDWLTGFDASAYSPGQWKGCMMARTDGGHDQDDATPSEAPFQAMLFPSSYPQWGVYGWKYVNGGSSVTFVQPSSSQKPGDNGWKTGSTDTITEDYPVSESGSSPTGWNMMGPNVGCPYQPIVPETSDQATLLQAVDNMRMVWRGGTMIPAGLQAGWLTISPKWKGLWGDSTLPRDTGNRKMEGSKNRPFSITVES